MSKKIIFVGGIHGVGKTTLCRNVSNILKIDHYSSSDLIKNIKNHSNFTNKQTSNIKENQDILLTSIEQFCPNDSPFILDGHFCLLNSQGNISRIPLNTFINLQISSIVVIINSANTIMNNLYSRDSIHYPLNFIEDFQKEELSYAKEVANSLNINCIVIDLSKNTEDILSQIESLI